MPIPLVVLMGAGSSYDCTTKPGNSDWRPPLVKDLFADRFASTLAKYPLAQLAAAEINRAMAAAASEGKSIAVEQHIRESYRDSEHESDRKKFAAIPWYLQEIIYNAGSQYTRDPDNVGLLVSDALRFPEVIFVTLNYDTILDQRLAAFDRIDGMADYIAHDRIWKLIKPHGSVNWGYRIADESWDRSMVTEASSIPTIASEITYARPSTPLDTLRFNDGDFYPALSVPLGSPDDIVCPPDHIEFLRARLAQSDGRFHLLVIGYSGLDDEVLAILKEVGAVAVTGRIVVNGENEGFAVRQRLSPAFDVGPVIPLHDRFGEFVQGGGFADFIDEVRDSPWSPWRDA